MMGEGKDSEFSGCSEHVVVEEEALSEQPVGFEAGNRTVIGVPERVGNVAEGSGGINEAGKGIEVGRDDMGSANEVDEEGVNGDEMEKIGTENVSADLGIEDGVGDLGIEIPSGVGVDGEGKEVCMDEKYAEEVKKSVVEERDAEEVKESVVEERDAEEVKESVVEEKDAEEVKERVVEEKDAEEVKESVVDGVTQQDEGVLDVEVKNEGNAAEGSGGIGLAGSAGKDIEVVSDNVVDARKVDEEGEMRGIEMVGSDEAANGSVDDDVVEKHGSNMVDGASVMGGVKEIEEERVETTLERELVDGSSDVWDDLKANKVGASGTEVQCHLPGTTDACTSASLQNFNVKNTVTEESSGVIVQEEVLAPNNDVAASDDLEGCVFNSDRPGSSGDETNCIRMTKDTETSAQRVVGHGQVIVDGKIVKVTEEKIPCSNVEEGSSAVQKMDIDKQINRVGQMSHDYLEKGSDDELLKVATDGVKDQSPSGDAIVSSQPSQVVDDADITVMHDKFFSGQNAKTLNPSCSGNGETIKAESDSEDKTVDTQMVDSGVSLMETDEALNTNPGNLARCTMDQHLSSNECLDNHSFADVSQIDSSGQDMQVEKLAEQDKQVGSGAGEDIKAKKIGESDNDQGTATAVQPTQVVEGGVESGSNIAFLTDIDVPMPVDTDRMASCQGYDQKLGVEMIDGRTKANTKVATEENTTVVHGQQVLDSVISARGSKEAEEQLKSDAWLDSCVSHDMQSELGKMQDTVVEKQANNAEQLGLLKEQEIVVGEAVNDSAGLHTEQEMVIEEQAFDVEPHENIEGQAVNAEPHENIEEDNVRLVAIKPGSSLKVHQASYLLSPEDDDKLSVSNLVWGKVRSHPWWPGQIFDVSDSSEQAMKYFKKDCFLVAYFGDRTFAWNDASQLKPFRQHFSQIEKHTNSESFQNAVSCALEEISRRVELGLACSCMSKDDYEKIRFQRMENAGVRKKSSKRVEEDKSLGVDFFEPGNLLKYIKALARLPSGGADRLELEIAKAQLLSFHRLKGYSQLPELQFCNEQLESGEGDLNTQDDMLVEVKEQKNPDTENEKLFGVETEKRQSGSYHRRKHNLKEGLYHIKKKRNGSELISETSCFPDDESLSNGKVVCKKTASYSGRKRKASEPVADDPDVLDGRKTTSLLKASKSPAPVPSFKIGNRICRVASQLTGPPITKNNTEMSQKLDGSSNEHIGDDFDVFFQNSVETKGERVKTPGEYTSLDELLSQLHLTAQDPFREHSSLNVIISFFSDFRNSVITEQPMDTEEICRKNKKSSFAVGDPETFEFEVEDVKDSYWTDRVIDNGSEEEPSQRKRKRDPVELAKSPQTNKRSYSKKRNSDGASKVAAEKTTVPVRDKKPDLSPTELLMFFPGVASIPSETNLNRTFRSFGPLWESETEIDQETNRARVIFKRCSDAEVAYNSAGRFNIFGATSVNYELKYTPSIPFKTLPPVTTQGQEDAT